MFEKKFLFENELISFKEFFLLENIKPKVIEYGIDLVNQKWLILPDNFYLTFFESNNEVYAVIYRNGYVGFATNYTDDKEKILRNIPKIRSYNEFSLKFHFNRKPIPNVMSVFNNVFYIITEAIQKFEPDEILFDGNDLALREFYSKILLNKSLQKEFYKIGFEYKGQQLKLGREFFVFQKI